MNTQWNDKWIETQSHNTDGDRETCRESDKHVEQWWKKKSLKSDRNKAACIDSSIQSREKSTHSEKTRGHLHICHFLHSLESERSWNLTFPWELCEIFRKRCSCDFHDFFTLLCVCHRNDYFFLIANPLVSSSFRSFITCSKSLFSCESNK